MLLLAVARLLIQRFTELRCQIMCVYMFSQVAHRGEIGREPSGLFVCRALHLGVPVWPLHLLQSPQEQVRRDFQVEFNSRLFEGIFFVTWRSAPAPVFPSVNVNDIEMRHKMIYIHSSSKQSYDFCIQFNFRSQNPLICFCRSGKNEQLFTVNQPSTNVILSPVFRL